MPRSLRVCRNCSARLERLLVNNSLQFDQFQWTDGRQWWLSGTVMIGRQGFPPQHVFRLRVAELVLVVGQPHTDSIELQFRLAQLTWIFLDQRYLSRNRIERRFINKDTNWPLDANAEQDWLFVASFSLNSLGLGEPA